MPAGSAAGPGSFIRDSFGNGLICPRCARGAYPGVARGGSTLLVGSDVLARNHTLLSSELLLVGGLVWRPATTTLR